MLINAKGRNIMSFLRHLDEMLQICGETSENYTVYLPENVYYVLLNDTHITVPKPMPGTRKQMRFMDFTVVNAGGYPFTVVHKQTDHGG